MKKLKDLIIVGTCLIIAGVTIIISENTGVEIAKILVPVLFLLSGIFTIRHSRANKEIEIASKFELLKGLGLITFAVTIFLISDGLKTFLMYVTYFILMYGLLELIFPFAVLNSKNKITKNMLVYRIVAGLAASIGALILLLATSSSEYEGLMTAGILTILIGVSNIIYASKSKKITLDE